MLIAISENINIKKGLLSPDLIIPNKYVKKYIYDVRFLNTKNGTNKKKTINVPGGGVPPLSPKMPQTLLASEYIEEPPRKLNPI